MEWKHYEVGQGKGDECTMTENSGVTIREALLLCDTVSHLLNHS